MKCSIEKVYKVLEGKKKTYLKCVVTNKHNVTFEFSIKPMFLSKKAYATLMHLIESNEK